MRCEIDLVDHQEIRARDAGTTLPRNLVAGGDVDHVDRQVRKLGREGRGQIVAAGLDQHEIERGEFLPHVGDRGEIDRGVLADRGVRTAAGLDPAMRSAGSAPDRTRYSASHLV